ncbi:hypothetical protein [Dokdonia sp. Dokd-P16]|uniref:hypothetical protein n=1 Tax=Dokdonia sp. Dokd-P16 TaxID=2173169 RepID=UPI0013A56F86|nr:hypothetical protein [Dokdonia sp. Dokd-P16]
MNNKKIAGIVIMAIAGVFMFAFDDVTGGIGFVSGIMMAIGLGLFLGWIPVRKKEK